MKGLPDWSGLRIYSAPAVEPVTPAEAEDHLRIEESSDPGNLDRLIRAARISVEHAVKRALVTQTWDMTLDAFPGAAWFALPFPPLQSITAITYKLSSGAERTFASTNYVVDAASEPGRVCLVDGAAWPGDTLYPLGAVKVRFVCGYGAAAAVPAIYKQAILLLVSHLYENRIPVQTGGAVELPMTVRYLLTQDRMWP